MPPSGEIEGRDLRSKLNLYLNWPSRTSLAKFYLVMSQMKKLGFVEFTMVKRSIHRTEVEASLFKITDSGLDALTLQQSEDSPSS